MNKTNKTNNLFIDKIKFILTKKLLKNNYLFGIIGLIILLIIWQVASFYVNKKILPSPFEVYNGFLKHYKSLFIHIYASLERLVKGILTAIIIGFPIGILIGYSKTLNKLLSPIIYLLAPIPKIALLPLIMLTFGIGEESKVFIIFIIVVFQIIVAIRDGVSLIPEQFFVSLKTIKASNIFVIRNILIPAVLPNMLTAIRVSLATGISVLFFAETFGTTKGIGFYIFDMWTKLDYIQMYMGIISLGVIGLLCVFVVDILERFVCRWRFI